MLSARTREVGCGGYRQNARKTMEDPMSRILLLDLDPETVDYSDPALPPGMTAEKVHAGIAVTLKQFTDRGWESDVCYIRPDETAGPTVERQLGSTNYDCVVSRRRAPAAPQSCIIRSGHQRYS